MIVTIRYKSSGGYRVIETSDFKFQRDVDFDPFVNCVMAINATQYRLTERMILEGKTKDLFIAPTMCFSKNWRRVYEEFPFL